ncbi:MAG: autotransporter-associated beta strand repeat-containing protein [Thermoguttaceae bacterium]
MRQPLLLRSVAWIAASSLGLWAGNLQAATAYWTGLTNNTWSTAASDVNWNRNGVDDYYHSGDDVVFDGAGGTVLIKGLLQPHSVDCLSGTYVLAPTPATSSWISYGPINCSGGHLIVATNNTEFAGSTINGGTLQVGNGGTTGTCGEYGTMQVNAGGTLEYYRADGHCSVYNNSITNPIAGSGAVVFQGTGVAGQSSYSPYNYYGSSVGYADTAFTGTVMVNQARLYTTVASPTFCNASVIQVNAGGQLYCDATARTWNTALELAGDGWLENDANSQAVSYGALRLTRQTYAGDISLTDDASITSYANPSDAAANGATSTVTGVISGNHQLVFRSCYNTADAPSTQDTLVLSPMYGNNSYGSTYIANVAPSTVGTPTVAGNITLVAGNAGAFSNGPVLMAGEVTTDGTPRLAILQLNGYDFSFANIASTNAHAQIQNAGLSNSVITVGSDNSSTAFRGALVDGGVGTLGLTKTGAGALALSGANTYTGKTTVQSGTLQMTVPAYGNVLAHTADIQGGQMVFDYTGDVTPAKTIRSSLQAGTLYTSTGAAAGYVVGYNDDGISAVTAKVSLLGDTDLGGIVNNDDLARLLSALGGTDCVWQQGDFNYDSKVNNDDLAMLLSNLGKTFAGFGSAKAQALGGAVPEPSTLVLLTAGLAGLLAYAWRKRK